MKQYHVSERLSRCNPDETSNYITYRNAAAIQTKPLSNNITYPNGSADAIQMKLYLCSLSERPSRCNPDETSNYKIYHNGSADPIQKKSSYVYITYPNGSAVSIQKKPPTLSSPVMPCGIIHFICP